MRRRYPLPVGIAMTADAGGGVSGSRILAVSGAEAGTASAADLTQQRRLVLQQLTATGLTHGQITLRALCESDDTFVYLALQDAEIQRWTTLPFPYQQQHAQTFRTQTAVDLVSSGQGLVFLITRGLQQLGLISLHGITGDTAAVGYWLAAWARGHGYAQAAVRLIQSCAVPDLWLRQLSWDAIVGNWSSWLVARQCGFRPEGRMRQAMLHGSQLQDCWSASWLPAAEAPVPPMRRLGCPSLVCAELSLTAVHGEEAAHADSLLSTPMIFFDYLWSIRRGADLLGYVGLQTTSQAAAISIMQVPPARLAETEFQRLHATVAQFARLALGIPVFATGSAGS